MTTGTTVHYLLVYSHTEQKLLDQKVFKSLQAATAAYDSAEAEVRGRSDEFEIVLVGADSLETIMKTHGHYFASDESHFLDLFAQHS